MTNEQRIATILHGMKNVLICLCGCLLVGCTGSVSVSSKPSDEPPQQELKTQFKSIGTLPWNRYEIFRFEDEGRICYFVDSMRPTISCLEGKKNEK
jgi:hypothetical protein